MNFYVYNLSVPVKKKFDLWLCVNQSIQKVLFLLFLDYALVNLCYNESNWCEACLKIANGPFYDNFSWVDYHDSINMNAAQQSTIVHRRRVVTRLLRLIFVNEHKGIKVRILRLKILKNDWNCSSYPQKLG